MSLENKQLVIFLNLKPLSHFKSFLILDFKAFKTLFRILVKQNKVLPGI